MHHVLLVEYADVFGFNPSGWKERRGGAGPFPARLVAALSSVTVTDGKVQLSCQKE